MAASARGSPVAPAEILEAIVDKLAEPLPKHSLITLEEPPMLSIVQTLGNMGLVSRGLYHRSRTYLFRQLKIPAFKPSKQDDGEEFHGQETLPVFQAHMELFSHVREVYISIHDEGGGVGGGVRAYPENFINTLKFILDTLQHLDYVSISSRRWRTWTDFDDATQQSFYRCLSSNCLTEIQIFGMTLPSRFLDLLPASIHFLDIRSSFDDDGDTTHLDNFLRYREPLCAPALLNLNIGDHFTSLVLRQNIRFFGSLQHLVLYTCRTEGFQDVQGLVDTWGSVVGRSPRLTTLSVEYQGFDTGFFSELHDDLTHCLEDSITDHSCQLTELILSLQDLTQERLALSTLSFGAVIQDHLRWLSSVTLEELSITLTCEARWDDMESVTFFHRGRDDFATVDDWLSDRRRYPNLNKFVVLVDTCAYVSIPLSVSFSPEDYIRSTAFLKDKLTKEMKAVFTKVSMAVSDFQIQMHRFTEVRKDWL
ncbi:hypothetical protein BKA70DRAFT_192171 [Coprinopsis sp. MPI-PUGE-AT-0042]|nr:hypothetical protein BKA70DRAFT_192171 [Coprinopsis sp. MPI-PUGE-AT-0042]